MNKILKRILSAGVAVCMLPVFSGTVGVKAAPTASCNYSFDKAADFNAIKGYCSKLNIDCKVRNKLIYITTSAASWFFFTNRTYIILYHESRRRNHAKAWGNLSKSFHIQDKTFTDPIDAIYYIYQKISLIYQKKHYLYRLMFIIY